MVMDPNLAPPAPPPMRPVTPEDNPYEFITQVPVASKKSRMPGGTSTKTRIIIVFVGLMILGIIGAGVTAFLGSADKAVQADYQNLIGQQAELIRVSNIGVTKAQQAEAKNLAITTNLSLISQQPGLHKIAKSAGAKTDAKSLASSKNSETDALLTTASQTNQFDSAFIKIMQLNLKKYQDSLKKLHDQSTSKSGKETLAKDYANASILIGEDNPAP